MLKKVLVIGMAIMLIGCGKKDEKIYDVIKTYDNVMVIETEKGKEEILFEGMIEEEENALHVLFINGNYVKVID